VVDSIRGELITRFAMLVTTCSGAKNRQSIPNENAVKSRAIAGKLQGVLLENGCPIVN
jgi:hypothetical protein